MVLVIRINLGVQMGSSEARAWRNIKTRLPYPHLLLVFCCVF